MMAIVSELSQGLKRPHGFVACEPVSGSDSDSDRTSPAKRFCSELVLEDLARLNLATSRQQLGPQLKPRIEELPGHALSTPYKRRSPEPSVESPMPMRKRLKPEWSMSVDGPSDASSSRSSAVVEDLTLDEDGDLIIDLDVAAPEIPVRVEEPRSDLGSDDDNDSADGAEPGYRILVDYKGTTMDPKTAMYEHMKDLARRSYRVTQDPRPTQSNSTGEYYNPYAIVVYKDPLATILGDAAAAAIRGDENENEAENEAEVEGGMVDDEFDAADDEVMVE